MGPYHMGHLGDGLMADSLEMRITRPVFRSGMARR
jgi:hypothetical protein